jgi:hypothetical protein
MICPGRGIAKAVEHRDWTRHGPGRTLLWWPFVAFALMAVFPDAGILPIVLSGLALAALGVFGGAAARWARRSAAESDDVVAEKVP